MNGDPVPRGGERHQPNPLFLAHAAALTELYVTLAVEAPAVGLSLSLFDYRREAAARESFKHLGKQRALAPDAMVILVDEQERKLGAFVEVDLGTMSHARLRQKADLYAAYTAADAWRDQHLFLPALLFLTTTEVRARRFLAALQSTLAHSRRGYSRRTLIAGAGALALEPCLLLDGPCLAHLESEELLSLEDVLEAARAPYEQTQRANRKRRESQDRKRAQLREDPAAARAALRRFQDSRSFYLEELGATALQAIEILTASTDDPCPQEHGALRALVSDLEDVLAQPGFLQPPSPAAETKRAVALLAGFYRERQQRLVEELAAHYGDGPSVRRARKTLHAGELLDHFSVARLPSAAKDDAASREEQHHRRLAYLEWREAAARAMVRKTGPLGRLAHSRDEFYPQIDREQLRVCEACREIVYPKIDPAPTDVAELQAACHYCGGRERLKPYRQGVQAPSEMEGCL
jgi:hypothetical protein